MFRVDFMTELRFIGHQGGTLFMKSCALLKQIQFLVVRCCSCIF